MSSDLFGIWPGKKYYILFIFRNYDWTIVTTQAILIARHFKINSLFNGRAWKAKLFCKT